MRDLINLYIADHSLSWAPSTLKSEKHRLYGVADLLTGDAIQFWTHLEATQKPYGRVTTWTRVVDFWTWMLDNHHTQGDNPYAAFRRKNARLFKNTYQTKTPEITFEEAIRRIKCITKSGDRGLALQIIGSGERYSESIQSGSNAIRGKGNKLRTTYRPEAEKENKQSSYASFNRSLRSIGLKPHDLRKLFASRLVEKGVKEADLLRIMGWSSMATAKAYLQPKNDAEIRNLIETTIHEEIRK